MDLQSDDTLFGSLAEFVGSKLLGVFLLVGLFLFPYLYFPYNVVTRTKKFIYKPSHQFAVTTAEAVQQLRTLLEKIEPEDHYEFLTHFHAAVIRVEKKAIKEGTSQDISEDVYKGLFSSYAVDLGSNDFEFQTTLNFSRATAKEAIVTLLAELAELPQPARQLSI